MVWDALWHLVGVLTGPTGLAVGAGALAGVLLVAAFARMVVARPDTVPVAGVLGQGMWRRARCAGVPRHRDPDAAGRTRPRGPC
jgi:hypothetical protein